MRIVVAPRAAKRSASGSDDPGNPAGTPATWVVAAAVRREFGHTADAAVLRNAAAGNQPPVIATVTVGRPSPFSGRVNGRVSASDPEHDELSFSVPAVSTRGAAVTINSSTGAFTYTPTAAVRHAAAVPGAANDSMTFTVLDGVGGTAATTVTVPVLPTNTRPRVAWTPKVDSPDPATGAVTGTLNARDADRDLLAFIAAPKKGSIVFGSGGAFTYVPTAAARRAAASPGATAAVKSDTFAVVVSDGHGGTVTKTLKVAIAPTAVTGAVTVLGSVAVEGDNPPASPVVSANGARGVLVTPLTDPRTLAAVTHVVVFDPATGTQAGTTLTLAGAGRSPVFSADGTRVLVTTRDLNTTTGMYTFRQTVVDAVTGAQIGTTVDLPGAAMSSMVPDPDGAMVVPEPAAASTSPIVSPDGARAVTVTQDYSDLYDTSTYTSRIAVMDTATGKQVGTSVSLTGAGDGPVFSNDGKYILFTASVSDWGQGYGYVNTSQLALIDSTTGLLIGDVVNANGALAAQFSDDSTHVLITTYDRHAESTVISTMSTGTGATTGRPISFSGRPLSTLSGGNSVITTLNTDGSSVLIGISHYSPTTTSATIRLLVGNTTTGTTSGTTVTLPGDDMPYGATLFSTDGKQVLITVNAYDSFGHTANSRMLVLDTQTGTQIGTTLALRGFASTRFSSDGRHMFITTNDDNTHITQAAVYDMVTGTQTGSTLTFGGYLSTTVAVGPDGRNAMLVIGASSESKTNVVLIDTVTGEQSGSAASLIGNPVGYPGPIINGDRAMVTTTVATSFTTSTSRVSVLQIG
ncbi:Ig-like domain-containing protein [Mycolicibacterium chubuense]|uniref:Ig-like domain-containing protein n=1 Tax=Mycolicibacterium chubuense TaxID=1800 RepID=UPI00103CCDAA|nr:PD40 domain-containing protein [Mycolicibacterium chubuense]